MKKKLLLVLAIFLVAGLFSGWYFFLSAPGGDQGIVSLKSDTETILVAEALAKEGYIRNEAIANWFLEKKTYPAGGYEVSKNMNVFEIAQAMSEGPQLLWVTIPPGLRKEEILERLDAKLNWDKSEEDAFLNAYKKVPNALSEGMFFPDTYLIPRNEGGEAVGLRMITKFQEAFAPYTQRLLEQNIKNDTALKIASLVQKEAGATDKKLVAGIIWNRLLSGMRLQIDATVQYGIGKKGDRWWPIVSRSDYQIDSPYNTYRISGLPPTPIANPSQAAIEAVIEPEETDCLYYLHAYKQIYCSPTYEGHLENIEMYLR